MNRKRFCDVCGIDGWLDRIKTLDKDDNEIIYYECLNCGKNFTIEERKKLPLL